jgi:hypothetical protein
MFISPESALRFAFSTREKVIISAPSGVFFQKEKNKNFGHQLTAYDFHAQAGMIFNCIGRMREDQQLWVYLTYGNAEERSASAKLMVKDLLRNQDARRYRLSQNDLIKILLSKSVRHCAKETGLTNYKSWKIRRSLHNDMNPVMHRVIVDMWEWLETGQTF